MAKTSPKENMAVQVVASEGDREQPFLTVARERDLSSWPQWLQERAKKARAQFEAKGFPHRRIEEWKYTDLRGRLTAPYSLSEEKNAKENEPKAYLDNEKGIRLTFSNGFCQKGQSSLSDLPKGVSVLTLNELGDVMPSWLDEAFGPRDESAALAALNGALLTDAVFIHIEKDIKLSEPFLLHSHTSHSGCQHHIRCVVVLEEGAEATLLEEHSGTDDLSYFSNMVVSVKVATGARLRHYKVQAESEGAFHLATIYGEVAAEASLESFYLSGGALLARNDIHLCFAGEGSNASVSGAYLTTGKRHCDTTSFIDHAVPDCVSREVFRGVLTDKSRGVFQGKIIVREDAQRTDGYQMSKALLLSQGAEVDAKPELEIYADDVKCSHGATSGELDEDSIFYLRSRGLDQDAARALLVEAFLDDAIEEISSDDVKQPMKQMVADWLKPQSKEGKGHQS